MCRTYTHMVRSRNTYRSSVRKFEGKRPSGSCKWEENIKMNFKDTECE